MFVWTLSIVFNTTNNTIVYKVIYDSTINNIILYDQLPMWMPGILLYDVTTSYFFINIKKENILFLILFRVIFNFYFQFPVIYNTLNRKK